jgi:putative ABC transport system permease protein
MRLSGDTMLFKSALRIIKSSLGRYIAIFTIIALGVGFFAGLRGSEGAMKKTFDSYVKELNLYDFKLVSTLGFTEDDVKAFSSLESVEVSRGSFSADFIRHNNTGSDTVFHAHMLLDDINMPDLVSGRIPQSANECLIDAHTSNDSIIGKKIILSDSNSEDTLSCFAKKEYTVVGRMNSAEYANFERGSTSLAGGSVSGYVYIPEDGFKYDYYSEIYLSIGSKAQIYSDKYEDDLSAARDEIEPLLDRRADIRFDDIYSEAESKVNDAQEKLDKRKTKLKDSKKQLADARAELISERAAAEDKLDKNKKQLDSARAELDEKWAALNLAEKNPNLSEIEKAQLSASKTLLESSEKQYSKNLAAYNKAIKQTQKEFLQAEAELESSEKSIDDAAAKIDKAQKKIDKSRDKLSDIKPATVFTLDRSSNLGCAAFENDTAIVSGVAKVFPLFFFLVAALVCITTMTRMVSEHRTENGVLRALGYRAGAVASQYLFYAGSASVAGCTVGFLIGSRYLPMAFWEVYHIMYTIDRPIAYVLNWPLFVVCLTLYLACALGVTLFVCQREMKEQPSQLIRPKAPEPGKRVFLERINFLWNRISFLHKVSIRNILRYKKRMVMMILGIGGCTALILTGFGIRDSIMPVIDNQYNEITLYDADVTFLDSLTENQKEKFKKDGEKVAKDIVFLYSKTATTEIDGTEKNINLMVPEGSVEDFVDFHDGGRKINFPKKGEAIINYRFAQENDINVGDMLTIVDDESIITVKISDIFDNYIYDYIYLSKQTYKESAGNYPGSNNAYVNFKSKYNEHSAGATLMSAENVANVNVTADMIARIGGMLDSLNYIVLIVLICAGGLAFVVLYNLTNITITERTREIATLKVLGFYTSEQNLYVFRENLVLTAISAVCGIPMGIMLLQYVMAQIKISHMYFGFRISPLSYLLSILITFLFTAIVDIALTYKTRRINMAEAMKAIE